VYILLFPVFPATVDEIVLFFAARFFGVGGGDGREHHIYLRGV
jgi:hypothetical protein